MISSGLLAGCLALSWRAPRWVLDRGLSLFAVRLGYTTMDWQRDSGGRHATSCCWTRSRKAPDRQRGCDRLGVWGFNAQEHICGYAVICKDALTNRNFVPPGVHMLTLRGASDGFRDPFHRILRRRGVPPTCRNTAPRKRPTGYGTWAMACPMRCPPGRRCAASAIRCWPGLQIRRAVAMLPCLPHMENTLPLPATSVGAAMTPWRKA